MIDFVQLLRMAIRDRFLTRKTSIGFYDFCISLSLYYETNGSLWFYMR